MPSNFHLSCFVTWTAALLCLSYCAPISEKSIWENFIFDLHRRNCQFPFYIVPKYNDDLTETEVGTTSQDTYDLSVPLKACKQVKTDSAEFPLCDEIFEVVNNITTCGNYFKVLSEAKPIPEPIDIEMQVDNVCKEFLENRNTSSEEFLSFKLADPIVCQIVCKTGDMDKACSFLLWSHRVQSAVHAKLKEARLEKAFPTIENQLPDGQDQNDGLDKNNQSVADKGEDYKKAHNGNDENVNSVDAQTKPSLQNGKNPDQKIGDHSGQIPKSKPLEKKILSDDIPKSIPKSTTTVGRNLDKKQTTISNINNTKPDVKRKNSENKQLLSTSGGPHENTAAQKQKELHSEKPQNIGLDMAADSTQQRGNKSIDVFSQLVNNTHGSNNAGTQSAKTSATNAYHKSASSTAGNNPKADSNMDEPDINKNGNDDIDKSEKSDPDASTKIDTDEGKKNVPNDSGKSGPNENAETSPDTSGKTYTKGDETTDAIKGGKINSSGSKTNTKKGAEISTKKGVKTSAKNVGETSAKAVEETSAKKDEEPKDDEMKTAFDETLDGSSIGNAGDLEDNELSSPDDSISDSDGQFHVVENKYNEPSPEEEPSGIKSDNEDNQGQSSSSQDADNSGSKLIPSRVNNGFPEQEDAHFFFYFITIVIFAIGGYVLFHNKQKIFALIIEGRHERRRRSGASYRKLETK